MKHLKWIAPACLALLMTVGLLAMNTQSKQPSIATSGTYFWYEYDPNTDQLGALLNPSSTIKIAKEDVPTDCQDDPGQPECARAYNESNRANQSNPPTPQDVILQTEPTK